VFSEPMRTLDMTKDTARKLAGLLLVAAEDREPATRRTVRRLEKPGERSRATVVHQQLSGIQTRRTVRRIEKPGVSRRHTVARKELSGNHVRDTASRTSPQPKTAMGVSDTFGAPNITSSDVEPKTSQTYSGALCCCIVTRWERQENRGCAVHGEEAPHG
jgi:hypothetical protein